MATRSGLEGDPKIQDLWIQGPSFLQEQESEWPRDVPWMAVVEEIRSSKAHRVMHISKSLNWEEVLLNEDNFQGLIKANEDQINWLKRCQEETFPEELRRLKKNKPVKPNSKLLSLSPILRKEGLIRIGGRINRAPIPYDSRHPIILPRRHTLTNQIAAAFYKRLKHTGTDLVLSHIRQHFWIIRG